MSNRCPSCEKMVSLDFNDPEVESIEVEAEEPDPNGDPKLDDHTTLSVTANVRIVRVCADCGEEMKEATLDLEETSIEGPIGSGHEFEVEEDSVDQIEEGGGRYAKSYFGAEVGYTITCTCGCGFARSATMSDKVAASEMDEMN